MIKNSLNKIKFLNKLLINKYNFSNNNNQEDSLIYEKKDNGIIYLKLNEQENRNALSFKMIKQLKEYTEMINNDE
jgi:1,4-dihydroxy-2-naphthoyl-CoA synthase